MFHHIAISAAEPFRVAKVLAELTSSPFYEFPVTPGAYIVINNDDYGSGVEILPQGSVWFPGETEAEVRVMEPTPRFSPIHAALSVSASRETIEAIGAREGWLVRLSDRGPFQVIELWLENSFMLELLTADMVAPYLQFMKSETYAAFLAEVMTAA